MLIRELLEHSNPQVSGYELINTAHVFQRARERGIDPAVVKAVLKRVGYAKKQIAAVGETVGVSLWDSVNGIHVIVRKVPQSNKLTVITVYPADNPKVQRRTPIVRVR